MMAPMTREQVAADALFPRMKEYIIKLTGLNYFRDKDGDLAERLARRLASLRIADCAEYVARLESTTEPRELHVLVTELTIGETYFFRHAEQFDALRDLIFPEILERNRASRTLRVWSAGCASGAEPYSVSILLQTHFQEQLQAWDVSVLGTDINKDFLELARNGCYDEWAFRGTSADLRQRCFSRAGKKWAVGADFKKGVTFQHHNLVTDPFPPAFCAFAHFDLILCRNVVIYFDQDDFRKIVAKFEHCMNEGAWLLVGHAEPNTEMFDAFSMVSLPGAILYRKKSPEGGLAAPAAQSLAPADFWTAPAPDAWRPAPLIPALQEWRRPSSRAFPTPDPKPPAPAIDGPPADFETVRRLADQGQWDQARAACEELLLRDNLRSTVHFFHALILEHLNRGDDSEQALRRAVYLDRNFALAHYYLGLRQLKKADNSGAARSFETVLRLVARLDAGHVFSEADGTTAAGLKQMAQMQLEALGSCEKRSTGRK